MLKMDRAREVVQKQNQWPYWGNFSKFMTPDEIDHVRYIVEFAKSGTVSFGGVVTAIALDRLDMFPLRDGIPSFEEMNRRLDDAPVYDEE